MNSTWKILTKHKIGEKIINNNNNNKHVKTH